VTRAEESLDRLVAGAGTTGIPSRGAEPEFVTRERAAGADAFRRLRLPTTREEDWKYTSLSGLAQLALHRPLPAHGDVAVELPAAPRLVFVDGRFDFSRSDLSGLPPGAVAASLADAIARTPELVEPWLGRRAPSRAHAFAGLNAALFEDGAFLFVPDGARCERPVHLVHLHTGAAGAAIHPRHLVVAGAGAHVDVAELYAGRDGAYLVNALTEVFAAERAEVGHVRVQQEGAGAYHVGLLEVEQGRASRFSGHSVALGAQLGRVESRALLAAEEADCTLEGLYVASGTQLLDHLVLVDHASPRCTSREVYKGVLDDKGHGVFAGRIRVRQDAQKTDASQLASNLLLSDDAIADAKPQLEIDADDVKCSHGGSVGQLDETALFYMRSRGIAAAEARALLTWAFASELVDHVRPDALRGRLRRAVAARLARGLPSVDLEAAA
jgi:Fe-S cluster assembly protein SufD